MTNTIIEILCYLIILIYGLILFLYPEEMAKKSLHLKPQNKIPSKLAVTLNKYGGLSIIVLITICIILTFL